MIHILIIQILHHVHQENIEKKKIIYLMIIQNLEIILQEKMLD